MSLENFKSYWPIALSVTTVLIALTGQWALFGYRVNALEERQDRQGDSIIEIRQQIAAQAVQYAEIKAQLSSVDEKVDYIRDRIDRVIQ